MLKPRPENLYLVRGTAENKTQGLYHLTLFLSHHLFKSSFTVFNALKLSFIDVTWVYPSWFFSRNVLVCSRKTWALMLNFGHLVSSVERKCAKFTPLHLTFPECFFPREKHTGLWTDRSNPKRKKVNSGRQWVRVQRLQRRQEWPKSFTLNTVIQV